MDFRRCGVAPYAWAGMAGVVLMVTSVLICLIVDTEWEWSNGSMCDFGVSNIKAISVLFVAACEVSGILIMISGFGWYLFQDSKYVRIGGVIIMLAGLSLSAVGVFDKTYSFHQFVSILFAIIFIIAIALVSVQDILDRNFTMVICLALLGLFGLATIFFPIAYYSVVQLIMMGFVFFWFVVKTMDLMRSAQTTPSK